MKLSNVNEKGLEKRAFLKQKLIDFWLTNKIITDKRVIKAFKELNREKFIKKEYLSEAYSDYPLPIGHNQTISQPTTIAIMTQALELKPTDKVLEIGTGSGYQAALIAKIARKVITTEIIPELIEQAKKNIKKANIKNIKVIHTDGSQGYEKERPYDKIIVTAATPNIPKPLIKQLKEKGIIVAPVGPLYSQTMVKGVKMHKDLSTESLGSFVFVPLKGKYGF